MKAVVLAGERPGGNAIARETGAPAAVLVSVAGKPSIGRVIDTLRRANGIDGGVIAGPDAGVAEASPAIGAILEAGDYHWVEPAAGPAESALQGIDHLDAFPMLLTTGDHALLAPATVERFVADANRKDADAVVGLAPYDAVLRRFPGTRRTRLRFRRGSYCGTNLFLLKTPAARAAVSFWREAQRHRKRPWRIASLLGVLTLARYVTGSLDLAGALAALSRAAGCRLSWVEVTDEQAAVDVDSSADLAIAEQLLTGRSRGC